MRFSGLPLVISALGLAACSSYDATLGSVTEYELQATGCGTWDSSGVHTPGEYFVGHSSARPNDTIAYFVFDLTPLAGRTVTAAGLSLPGTSDWKTTVTPPAAELPGLVFKLGTTPLPTALTLAEVTTGMNDPSVYRGVEAEPILGFSWVASGADINIYDAFHYDAARLQAAVAAGGFYPLFGVPGYGVTATTDEYLYGSSAFDRAIVLKVSVE